MAKKKKAVSGQDQQARIAAITDLYTSLLGRQPDQAGLDAWVTSGKSLDNVRAEMLKSQEYKRRQVGTSSKDERPSVTPKSTGDSEFLGPPGTAPTPDGGTSAIPGGGMEGLYPPSVGSIGLHGDPGQGGGQPQVPASPLPSLFSMLSSQGMDLSVPVGDALSAFFSTPQEIANARIALQQAGVDLASPIGGVMQTMGLTGSETLDVAGQRLGEVGQVSMPSPGQFPQAPGITLPPGLEPQPFQMPAMPSLPTMGDGGVDLAALMNQFKGTFDAQQAQRQSVLDALNAGIAEQQANARNNQPMLDAAMANIQSVLTGQAMSPGLEGLINSAFSPAEAEGQRKLRQAAEEAAAARGMSLTDSPIGNPYLEENRRFLEQMGGQRAQMGAQLREQDAAFSQNIRAFQEGLKQQALSNQTEVLRSLGTPEQAASVLGQLGLGAKNAAVQQYATQMQGALGAADQGLRAALGQASTNQGNTQLALASQAQNFQQQLSKQQAAIQNQLAMFGVLGDPSSAYGSFSGTGSNLSNLPLMNNLNLIGSLSGNAVGFNPASQGGGGSGSTLGNMGSFMQGLGSLFNTNAGTNSAGQAQNVGQMLRQQALDTFRQYSPIFGNLID